MATSIKSMIPQLDLIAFEDREFLAPAGRELQAVALPHGVYRSYGFRMGDLGVLIDGKATELSPCVAARSRQLT